MEDPLRGSIHHYNASKLPQICIHRNSSNILCASFFLLCCWHQHESEKSASASYGLLTMSQSLLKSQKRVITETQWTASTSTGVGRGSVIFVCLLLKVHAESEIWYSPSLKYWLSSVKESCWTREEAEVRRRQTFFILLPAMCVHAAQSSVRLSAENQWSLTSCSWVFRPMAGGADDAGSPGRTVVRSLTEMVSLATGDTGSAAAAGKRKNVSLW